MGSNIIFKNEFNIAGIQVRTSNKHIEKIQELWNKFFSEKIYEKVQNKINPEQIYCIYTDYESDFNGDYTCLIGFEVDKLDNISDGLISRTIQKAKYQTFSDKGSVNEITPNLWKKIWNTKLDRVYKADFELYDLTTIFSENSEVKIFICIE